MRRSIATALVMLVLGASAPGTAAGYSIDLVDTDLIVAYSDGPNLAIVVGQGHSRATSVDVPDPETVLGQGSNVAIFMETPLGIDGGSGPGTFTHVSSQAGLAGYVEVSVPSDIYEGETVTASFPYTVEAPPSVVTGSDSEHASILPYFVLADLDVQAGVFNYITPVPGSSEARSTMVGSVPLRGGLIFDDLYGQLTVSI